MIDDKSWSAYTFRGGPAPSTEELLEALKETFTCPRCGRPDLPLALFPHHNRSCAFECGLGGAAIDVVSDLQAEVEDLRDRVKSLEMSVRDGIHTIQWFGGWLNNRKEPVTYDKYYVPCKDCGVTGEKHGESDCAGYMPSVYSVSYTARDVAIMVNSMCKALGPEAAPKWTEFRCDSCHGLFDREHVRSDSDFLGVRCTWCRRK